MTGQRKEIAAEAAKAILQDKDERLEGIDRKFVLLQEELWKLEDGDSGLILASAMPSKTLWAPPGGGKFMDNTDVVLRYHRQKQQRIEEILFQLWELSEEADEIRRLWNCFLALPEPYYGILHRLYVEKELYAEVEKGSGHGHGWFEKRRKEGLALMVGMFNSGYSSLELMEASHLWDKKKGRKPGGGCSSQIDGLLARLDKKGIK